MCERVELEVFFATKHPRARSTRPQDSVNTVPDEFYKRDEKLQKRLSTEVDALARRPENSTCADCGEPKRIRFCSVTLGVFLCNRCYGLHRALGAHVTRGKVLGLDAWKPEEVELLRSIGNAKARAVYEARCATSGVTPPVSTASDREVAAWIKDKYERRKYYDASALTAAASQPAPRPPPAAAVAAVAVAAAPPAANQKQSAPPAAVDLLGDGLPTAPPAPLASFAASSATASATSSATTMFDDFFGLDLSAGQSMAAPALAAPVPVPAFATPAATTAAASLPMVQQPNVMSMCAAGPMAATSPQGYANPTFGAFTTNQPIIQPMQQQMPPAGMAPMGMAPTGWQQHQGATLQQHAIMPTHPGMGMAMGSVGRMSETGGLGGPGVGMMPQAQPFGGACAMRPGPSVGYSQQPVAGYGAPGGLGMSGGGSAPPRPGPSLGGGAAPGGGARSKDDIMALFR